MRLVSYDSGRVGKVVGDDVVDLTHLVPPERQGPNYSPIRRLISNWEDLRDLAEGETADEGNGAKPLKAVQLSAPVPDPSKIAAAPVNYADHMTEMHETHDVSHLGIFLKAPSSILSPGGTIQLPYSDRRFDQEGELAVVIGRRGHDIEVNEALDYVFGYTGLLDITMRGGEDRSTRKSFDTFTPMGPWVTTLDEFGPPDDVELRCWVNGDLRQEANTRDLVWGVAQLIAYVSSVMTLEPGDIVSTGTPAGVGPLHPGDAVEVELASRLATASRLSVTVAGVDNKPSVTLGADSGPVPPPPKADVGSR